MAQPNSSGDWFAPQRWGAEFRHAHQALTRFKLGKLADGNLSADQAARAVWAYPLAGLTIGVAASVLYFVAIGLGLTPLIAALFVLALLAWLTGARHDIALIAFARRAGKTDGAEDAPLPEGPTPIERVAEGPMADASTNGWVIAAICLILLIGARLFAIADLGDVDFVTAALIGACVASRAAMAAMQYLLRPFESGPDIPAPTPGAVTAGCLIALVITVFSLGLGPALIAIIVMAVAVFLTMLIARRAGEQTMIEAPSAGQALTEAVFLVTATVLI